MCFHSCHDLLRKTITKIWPTTKKSLTPQLSSLKMSIPWGKWSSGWCHSLWRHYSGSPFHPGYERLDQFDRSEDSRRSNIKVQHPEITAFWSQAQSGPSCWSQYGGESPFDLPALYWSPLELDATLRCRPPSAAPCEFSWVASLCASGLSHLLASDQLISLQTFLFL